MKSLKCFILFLLCNAVVVSITVGQPLLKYSEYKAGGAMDHTRVSCYVQDSKGLLWFGTWIGLCRYDGKSFHFFRNTDGEHTYGSLGSNRILRMTLDSQENIWCQNYDLGLYRFDRKTSTFQPILPYVQDYQGVKSTKGRIFAMLRNHAVWTMMEDGTLLRFDDLDPSNYDIFKAPNGRSIRDVYEIVEDSENREWLLTDQGVYIYGQGFVTGVPYSEIVVSGNQVLLAKSSPFQVMTYGDDNSLHPVQLPREANKINTTQLHKDHIVTFSTDQGLFLYDLKLQSVDFLGVSAEGKKIQSVTKVFVDSDDRMWFFANGGDFYMKRACDSLPKYLPLPKDAIDTQNETGKSFLILQDVTGNIWLKSPNSELCWIDQDNLTVHSNRECFGDGDALPIRNYNVVFEDQQHTLWVSSTTTLYHLYFGPRQFQRIQMESDVEVRALMVEDNTHIWYGDKQGHVCRYDLATGHRSFLTPTGGWSESSVIFYHEGVYSMLRDKNGHIWIGTRGSGLYELEAGNKGYSILHHYNQGNVYDLNCNNIYDLYEDEYGRLWVATFGGGVNMVDRQPDASIRFIHAANDLKNYPIQRFSVVRSICGDRRGRLLAGTNKGVLAFSSDYEKASDLTFHMYETQTPMERPLQDNMVMQIVCGKEGDFYASSYSRGLSRVEGQNLSDLHFDVKPNLDYPAGDVNQSAIMHSNGDVWTVAESGVTCYSPSKNSMRYFDEQDFDRPYSMTECTPVELPDGRIVVGTIGGILMFDASHLSKSVYSPKIVITERQYAKGADQFVQELNDIDTLRIEPEQRSSSLHFAALDYVSSRLIRYAYWMQEIGDESIPQWVWTDTPEMNIANMAPGNYRLHIRSTNGDGIWCDNERILTLLVIPTFWEQWGSSICLLILSLGVAIVLIWYIRRSRQRQIQAVKQEVSAAKIEMLSRPADRSDSEFIQKLMSVMESHLADSDLQVNNLADEMNMSRATFYRRLKNSVDLSPNDFIHQVRMKRSAEKLATTDESISQIAYAVGFNNPKYFSKCFKSDYGMSPVEYRNKMAAQQSSSESEDSPATTLDL